MSDRNSLRYPPDLRRVHIETPDDLWRELMRCPCGREGQFAVPYQHGELLRWEDVFDLYRKLMREAGREAEWEQNMQKLQMKRELTT